MSGRTFFVAWAPSRATTALAPLDLRQRRHNVPIGVAETITRTRRDYDAAVPMPDPLPEPVFIWSDGVQQDDTEALQAEIDRQARESGRVRIAYGVYRTTATVYVPEYTLIYSNVIRTTVDPAIAARIVPARNIISVYNYIDLRP